MNIGFTIIGGKTSWMGGINYLKNLLYAISKLEDDEIKPILFVGKKTDITLLKNFEGLAEIRRHSVFDRFSFNWFIDTLLRDLFQINPILNRIIRTNDIQVFSHSYIYGRDLACKTINWIPDFQHIHLPKMFSPLNLFVRNYRLKLLSKYSDLIVFSSNDAFNDFKKFSPEYVAIGKVIHFVSQSENINYKTKQYLEEKYDFKGAYFFLPNQFWLHKNHKIAFEAINIASKKNKNILLICTGEMEDNRSSNHFVELNEIISSNSLEKNILLLGKIPFNEMLSLMKNSIAVVNPSFFEGWSSTVEESKTMQQDIILSNIPVHIEQAKEIGTFFNPNDADELAAILLDRFENQQNDKIRYKIEDINIRTMEFANQYRALIEVAKKLKNDTSATH